ncbi:hypothetical protein SAMN05444336_101266 [Albimonas donghaensis]|uniref:Uncharacterized protein n=1 Tax=Albimonas donghaensis TaxID=356660 RepID=A0A1H2R7V3_9RHOB|nr:hypothetical protein [Albimonas donghaensis]SDW15563.1 hypothetical protein SAMN05444336_101266 [Albimonas donghaensis]
MGALRAIRYTGRNAREVCEFVTGERLAPFELKGGFWLRQRPTNDAGAFRFSLVAPAKHGEVELQSGDWMVREVDGWVRLSEQQFRAECREAAAP